MRKRYLLIVFVLMLGSLLVAACGGGGGGGNTQADQVAAGQTVYTDECSECHDQGVGPELNAAIMAEFANAQELYDYTHTNMPLDAPGSLTEEQYWNVTAYVLNNNDLLPADTVLGPDTAANVPTQ